MFLISFVFVFRVLCAIVFFPIHPVPKIQLPKIQPYFYVTHVAFLLLYVVRSGRTTTIPSKHTRPSIGMASCDEYTLLSMWHIITIKHFDCFESVRSLACWHCVPHCTQSIV